MTATPDRAPGWSVRLRLALSYAGFLMLAGTLLLAVVWVFLLRYVPEQIDVRPPPGTPLGTPSGTGRAGAPPGSGVLAPRVPFVPNRADLVRAFVPKAAAALVVLLLFGLAGGWLLAGRMLAPLTRLRDAARLAATGSLTHRVRLEGRADEFRELADAFDAMLARLEAHVAEQGRFAANASHELRTPLAITRTLLDVARRDPERDAGELIERLDAVNDRAVRLTEALLALSRADARAFAREPVDLSLLAEEAAETLLPLAERRGVALEVQGEETPTLGSRALLLQLTTNLVHNAIVHNLPEGGTVRVQTARRTGSVVLTVENSGERLAPPRVATFTEPFQRGTERTHGDHAGVGLGLAIVGSIARAHDGTLALAPRPCGGLRVTVRLPAAPP